MRLELYYFRKLLLMAAAADPLEGLAEVDLLASPTLRPELRIAAPVIFRVSLKVALPEGE